VTGHSFCYTAFSQCVAYGLYMRHEFLGTIIELLLTSVQRLQVHVLFCS
jgi:hypothetical protein